MQSIPAPDAITLFLAGDVMTGRGIDQILPHPGKPRLYESWARSALDYVRLAEHATGPLRRPVAFSYVWGDALAALRDAAPDLSIVNLETAVTTSDDARPDKGIHYRMHPANVPCLTAARLDCCVLANNHVLDWGRAGLLETLDSLHGAGIATAGAGRTAAAAAAPAVLAVPGKGRVLVHAWATEDSGVPPAWRATATRAGVSLLPDLGSAGLAAVLRALPGTRPSGDLVLVSLHWGGNWGFGVPPAQRGFAHRLIDTGAVDVIHGHSSHHVKGIEVYRGTPILYGCGDLLNDYEGIGGFEQYRGELALLYFPTLTAGGLVRLVMLPTRTRHFQIRTAPEEGARWLAATLRREGRPLGTDVERTGAGLLLRWGGDGAPLQ